jgi:dynein heavy chain
LDKDEAYKEFFKANPSLEDYETKLAHFGTVDKEIGKVGSIHVIGALSLNTKHLKKYLRDDCNSWIVRVSSRVLFVEQHNICTFNTHLTLHSTPSLLVQTLQYSENLHLRAKMELEAMTEYTRVTMGKLSRKVEDLDSLGFMMRVLREVRDKECSIDMEINPIMDMYRMLECHLSSDFMEKEEIDKKTVLKSNWKKLILQALVRTDELSNTQIGFEKGLLKDIDAFNTDVQNFLADFTKNGPLVKGLAPMEAVDRLSRFKEEVKIRERKFDLYHGGEELFALPHKEYPGLDKTKKDIKLASLLFDLYVDVIRSINDWKLMTWESVAEKISEMGETMESYAGRQKKLPGKLREYESFTQLKKEIDDFQTILPLLEELSKNSIKARHWEEVMKICNTTFDVVGNPDFKLQSLLEANLVSVSEEIEEVTDGADKQLKIEHQLGEIKNQWKTKEFLFTEWKDRGVHILKATPMVVEELEEAQMNLQTVLTMRHVAPFRNIAQELLGSLSETSDTLESWVKVQMMWCALESVFTGGDIAKQLPKEAKKFAKIDKDWAKIMNKASECRNVVECCADELLQNTLPTMYGELEKCQKSLEGYLEQKQKAFPRFYFVSNAKLLTILSQGSDPLAMNEYYENVFDAIQYVEHDKKDKTIIRKIHGDGGAGHEVIPFIAHVEAVGNIEDWLTTLLKTMRLTLKDHAKMCSAGVLDVQNDLSKLRPLVDSNIAQFALLAIQIMWTYETQTALEQCKTKKNAMKDNSQRQLQVLSEMSSWCLQDLDTKVNRKKIETLVTVHVHQRDIAQELYQLVRSKKVHDANDFDWLKQARFYWRPSSVDDVSNDGATVVSITDVDFNYQYEYLGAKERLVITPLTDKCYITLAQALGMYFGGAPAGPAGTGKTETTKDLGNTLGIFVVVTNCTDQMKYTDCAKIFKGLCQGGLWGCFDEFNRITLPVLSVVAQQVLAIQNAKKQGVEFFQFPGDPQNVVIQPVCAFFITMNPGYAGRQELPENLKALFRGVAMMVPDFQIIKKVKMCSVGYSDFDLLSQKFFALYSTCKEQLSNQRHYDWGLRNILSVLRTMGATKRENLDKPEAYLVYRTVRDMNLSKLVAQDVPLFLSLLADLFPDMSPPPKSDYPKEEEILKTVVEKYQLVHHEDWVLKVKQLYETTKVRHGIMLVGPSGGGKSCIFKCLKDTLQESERIQYKDVRFNPKAIRAQEMYGETDPFSGEWTTGVFAAIWAKYNNRNNAFNTWIIADGPVDAIWIEDLNTVLDDNRILTLANGDRIPMTDNVKIMFEVETLVNASPATVSRAGIIYVSETDLDWTPVLEAWVRKRPDAAHQTFLRSLIDKWIGASTPVDPGKCFDFLQRNTSEVMKEGRVGRISSFSQLFQGLTEGPDSSFIGTNSKALERIFVYCLCWSVGSLLEAEDRMKFDIWLRERDDGKIMPKVDVGETIYEYFVNGTSGKWEKWKPPAWAYPDGEKLDFSNLLVPTMDSTRAQHVIKTIHHQKGAVLVVGAEGTAKTSTQLMFLSEQDPNSMLTKRINFSSATTPGMAQYSIEAELDKRGGKNFGPPNGKKMTIFFDDVSMPEVNTWGDQTTLELVRLVVEHGGFYFLDKDKRGDFKTCEDLQYLAAMQHPGGGKNDIPNRLKRNFFIFNLVLPSITSINDIYGQMLDGRFTSQDFDTSTLDVVGKLTNATIQLWRTMKTKMLPTPAKFHYVFNMRDLSRVFQGILFTPKDSIIDGGLRVKEGEIADFTPQNMVLGLWRHECDRVFCDKLATAKDKESYEGFITAIGHDVFGNEAYESACSSPKYMVSFLRDDVYDDDEIMIEEAPKVYEDGGTLEMIRDRACMFLDKYNEEYPSKKMELVLFEDALKHMLRISRLIEMPRGSGLLVGVGGSGKQSLTRLASYISRAMCFQITLTKHYNRSSLMDDIRILYKNAGHKRQPTTFLFTESEIKDEVFLETINSILSTGEVPGLFAKDEMMAMTADIRLHFLRERPGKEETPDNLKQYFTDCVRDNLHIILCMSPMNAKFPVRARKFPGLVSSPTIDWFLAWPEEALVSVSRGFVKDFPLDCTEEVKTSLMTHMGMVHKMVTDVCDEYFNSMRRQVYQTPKSYLSFIATYKSMYSEKLGALKEKESRVKLGLDKLIQGAKDVEAMKIILAAEQVKLEEATISTNKMLESLEVSSAEAKAEGEQVAGIKSKCEADAVRIASEKASCQNDLAKAQPFVDEANAAINSIKPAHIGEIKKLANPSDIIKLVFDCVLILFNLPLGKVVPNKINMAKTEIGWFEPSFKQALQMMSNPNFLNHLVDFGKTGKDLMNDETIEFLSVYIDVEQFNPSVAKNASTAAEGLCTYVRAMKFYHEASKIVKPKLEALSVAEGQMEAANKALAAAEKRLAACNEKLADLQSMFDEQISKKRSIEEGAMALQKKMNQASALINGLAGERARWTEDAANFCDQKMRLVGDCAIGCAFMSYCGPFNQQFRNYMICDKFTADCEARNVPVTRDLDVISFLADVGTIGDWNMDGLPTDPLSTQNGILVTSSTRFPLLIDPQGQALNWIKNKERSNLPTWNGQNIVDLSDPKLKDKLELCMGDGKSLIIVGVEDEIDPMLDPVLEKEITKKGSRMYVNVSDKMMDYDPNFKMYFITRLPNPSFSPELQAKTTLIDFTVTQIGLEEQLLGKVISKEQKALEEQLTQVLEEVNANTKSLMLLDASLLERLTSNTGDLLDDEELVSVLANTKKKAAEVNAKLIAADETRLNIAEKREQFRPAATRGSVLYFSIVEMSLVNVMYQTSLTQFLELFMGSIDKADKATLASKRVSNIIETMTHMTYRYINRGLYEQDKLTFVLLVTMKILVAAGHLKVGEVTLFLRGGAALDINSVRRKPFQWMSNEVWLNVVQLCESSKFYFNLIDDMVANEIMWKRWYEDNTPEKVAIPDYEQKLLDQPDIGPFLKLLLVRCLRVDRSILMCKEFIRSTKEMGSAFVEPVTDTIEMVYDDMEPDVPVIFLLSRGSDPTDGIIELCRKKKLPAPAVISLGEGQEPVALKAINAGVVNGTWVLLQNCELGLGLMNEMEPIINKLRGGMDPNFRLFITALPHPEFPLGLLQMCTKVTNDPPAGLRAGLLRSYTPGVMVDQDRLERVDTAQWRQLIFALCFLHSVVQERRKFGPLGWCIPYEYNNGDLQSCMLFLEKHLYNGEISWGTFQYMVSDVQYGGKITDSLDVRLFRTYTKEWLNERTCEEGYEYNPNAPILKIPFQYTVQAFTEHGDFRKYIEQFPENDSPEIFGLHPNADLTFRVKEATALFKTLGETQPKGGVGDGGFSREDVVYEKAAELLSRLPEDYDEDDYKTKIRKLGGMTIPMNIFLFQEIQRLQAVIAKVRFTLSQLQLAIKGEVVMTAELQETLDSMFDARVPHYWENTLSGDEFSWRLPTLGLWFSSLLNRDNQYRTWLNNGRPNSFWLTGFFNPNGCLTAMKQEVTRKHKAEKWALNDVVYHTEVTNFADSYQIKAPPDEGIYVHGLSLEGCAWSRQEGCLVESQPKELYSQLPVLYVTGNIMKAEEKSKKERFGAVGAYECPVYKYNARMDKNLIFSADLKCDVEKPPSHWTLRGAALLLNT